MDANTILSLLAIVFSVAALLKAYGNRCPSFFSFPGEDGEDRIVRILNHSFDRHIVISHVVNLTINSDLAIAELARQKKPEFKTIGTQMYLGTAVAPRAHYDVAFEVNDIAQTREMTATLERDGFNYFSVDPLFHIVIKHSESSITLRRWLARGVDFCWRKLFGGFDIKPDRHYGNQLLRPRQKKPRE